MQEYIIKECKMALIFNKQYYYPISYNHCYYRASLATLAYFNLIALL
jgi:hypothetical protein